MRKKILICFSIVFCTAAFALYPQSLSDSEAAARDAVRKLEDLLSGRNTDTNQAAAPIQQAPVQQAPIQESVQVTRGGQQPRWAVEPYTAFPRDRYIAAVGQAANRADAERKAFAALGAFFGQTVESDIRLVTTYSEAVFNGVITFSENTSLMETIVTAAKMDSLIGAQIGNVWDNGQGLVSALAYVDREITIAIYTELIRMNQSNIEMLTAMSDVQKYTFDGYARYRFAEMLAVLNMRYANMIIAVGDTASALNLTSADTLNLEASNIFNNISVFLDITGDHNNRLQHTFTRIINTERLRVAGNNTPYTLKVRLNLSEHIFPNNNNIFCDYVFNADFMENTTGAVLFQFSLTDRVAHLTYEGAKDRAVAAVERLINEQYPALFSGYLARVLPWN